MNAKPIRTLFLAFTFFAALTLSQRMATAQTQTVTLELMGPPGAGSDGLNADNIYLSPYFFSINGSLTNTALICDDFADEIFQYESWTATVYSGGAFPDPNEGALSTVTPTAADYEEIGYLADLLLTAPTDTTGAASTPGGPDQAALSFAIWAIFDPTDVSTAIGSLTTAEQTEYHSALTAAAAIAANPTSPTALYYLDNLTIYQPVVGSYNPSGDGVPQQFVSFNAPEALSPSILGFNLLVLLVALVLFRRRLLPNAGSTR